MDEYYNKHYIRIDADNNIIEGWSDGPHLGKDITDAICINERGGYQFRLFPNDEENPSLYNDDGIPLYKWDGISSLCRTVIDIAPEMVEQFRSTKLQDVNAACQQIIYAGIEVETSEGVKHFSLTEHDQTELLGLTAQVKEGTLSAVPYHADGELCKPWSVEDFIKIAESAQAHIFYHRTYCNHLRAYIKRTNDYDGLKAIFYGVELPEDLQDSINTLTGGVADA